MALVGRRTAAAGGADATVNSAAGVWGVIDAALIAAGWSGTDLPAGSAWQPSTILPPVTVSYSKGDIVTNAGNRYQCIQSGNASTGVTGPTGTGLSIAEGTCLWRFLTASGNSDRIYTSNGESGTETLYMRVYYQTASGTTVNMTMYQYWDGTFGYNRIGPAANAVSQHTFTAGNTVNYAVVADKDNFVGIFNDSANNRRLIGGGRLNRVVSGDYFVSNGSVSAGTNRTFTFASGDPIASGYKMGDRVFVVSQQANAADPHNTTIPLYAAKVVGLTSSSITIDIAQESTSAGALIGFDPMPLWFLNNSINVGLNSASYAYTNYRWEQSFANLFTSGTTEQGYLYNGSGRMLVAAAAADLDPNRRTDRVVIGEHVFVNSNNEVVGLFPKIYWNPRTTDALWAIGRSTKEASNFDYVAFPYNTASPTSQVREMIGPFTIAGGATFNVEIYKVDSNTWIQADIEENISDTFAGRPLIPYGTDRTFSVPWIARQGYPFQGEASDGDGGSLIDTDGNVVKWALYMPNLVGQGSDHIGLNQYGMHAAEPLPFDSPEAVSGGTGSSFNSGFN
jgi:hypothetical protein